MGVTDCILHLTAPEFVPCLVTGILYGIGAIILYDKSKRNKFFLSYFYLGSGALLYAVAEVFDLVWNRSEGEKSDFPLHASLLLLTFGATFFLLALFRLLETWQQVGMRDGKRAVAATAAPGAILVAMLISMVGGVLMVQQDQAATEGGEEDLGKTRMALQLQAAGAIMNLVILVAFFVYLGSLARRRRGQTMLAVVLGCLGGLVLIRWVYNTYLLVSMLMDVTRAEDTDYAVDVPGWPVFVGLVVVPEILAIVVSILYDLTLVKNGVEQLHSQQGFVHLSEAQGMQHV